MSSDLHLTCQQELVLLRQQVAQAQQERDAIAGNHEVHVHSCLSCKVLESQAHRAAYAETRLAEVVGALRKYGQHQRVCTKVCTNPGCCQGTCNCGLEAAQGEG